MDAQNWTDPSVAWVGVHARRTDLMLRCTSSNCAEGISVEEALPLSKFTDTMKEVASLAPQGSRIRFYLATDDPIAEETMKRQLSAHNNAGLGMSKVDNNSRMGTHLQSITVAEQAQNHPAAPQSAAALKNMEFGRSGVMGPHAARAALEGSDSASKNNIPLGIGILQEELPVVVSLPKATRDAAGNWLSMRSVVSGLEEAVADLYLLSRTNVLLGTVGSTFSQTAHLMGDAYFLTIGADLELKI